MPRGGGPGPPGDAVEGELSEAAVLEAAGGLELRVVPEAVVGVVEVGGGPEECVLEVKVPEVVV